MDKCSVQDICHTMHIHNSGNACFSPPGHKYTPSLKLFGKYISLKIIQCLQCSTTYILDSSMYREMLSIIESLLYAYTDTTIPKCWSLWMSGSQPWIADHFALAIWKFALLPSDRGTPIFISTLGAPLFLSSAASEVIQSFALVLFLYRCKSLFQHLLKHTTVSFPLDMTWCLATLSVVCIKQRSVANLSFDIAKGVTHVNLYMCTQCRIYLAACLAVAIPCWYE